MKKKVLLYICCMAFALQSCLKDDIGKSQVETFQYIWDELDQNYGGFMPRKVDWNSVYAIYYPKASACTTDLQLFDVCASMLDLLDDQHVFIYSNKLDKGHASGKEGDELLAEAEFDLSIVKSNYLGDFELIDVTDEQLVYGEILDKNVGYIYLPSFDFDGVRWFEQIDDVIIDLMETDGLIIDVRNNGGGSPLIDRYIASRFVAEEKYVFSIQSRNGKEQSDFDEPIQYFAIPEGSFQYTKSIAILANHSTVSAGEEFMLFLETQPHVTIVGDSTSNAFATETFVRLIPNSWELGFPSQLYTYPDGSSPEGIGIVPDIYIRNDSIDVQNGIDKVLEKAIQMF